MNQFQSFDEVLSALRRRLPVMLFVVIAGSLISLYTALQQVHLYQATAVIQIENPRVPEQLVGATAQPNDSAHRLRLIEQRLMSRDSILGIIEEFDLFADRPDLPIDQQVFEIREAARVEQIINGAQAWQPGVAPSGLYINVTLPDPDLAAQVANALMEDVIEQSRQRGLTAARETALLFEAEEVRVRAELQTLESRIAAFKERNAAALPAGQASARTQITTLRETELTIEREIVALESASSRIRENDRERQIALLAEQRDLVRSRIADLEQALAASPAVEQELNALELELENLEERFAVIARRKAEAELGQVLQDRQQSERFEVLETALAPEFPITRGRKQIAIMGFVASLGAALALGFVLELLNPALRSADQMERQLGLRPVVAIPTVQSRRETNRRRVKFVLIALAVLAAIYAMVRNLGERVIGMLWMGFTGAQLGGRGQF